MKEYGRKGMIVLFWLLVWQGAAVVFHNSLALASPLEVAEALFLLLPEKEFLLTVGRSLFRILGGFFFAWLAGMALGGLACRFPLLEEFFAPVMALMKSVPVASFVILALIVMGSERLTFLIVFLVVVPIVYMNTLSGLKSADPGLLEMAKVFEMSRWRRLWYIYRPAAAPFVLSACRVAVGMSFKSGVAAEVIGVPGHSIGEKLYMAKLYLMTADLFAWTIVIIVLSILCEKLVTAAFARLFGEKRRQR